MRAIRKDGATFEIIMIFIIAFVRLGLYGFSCFPVVDDWIQYQVYPLFTNVWKDVYVHIGLFATRPLAGLMDLYVWGKMPLQLAFFMITFLHAFSCILFLRVSRKIGIPLGIGFVLIYMMLPINTEATIWLSASTRLIVPMFFTSLSLFLYVCKEKNLFLIWLIQLISLLFYEQVAILSVTMWILVALYMHRKRVLWIPVANLILLGVYYKVFSAMGPFGSRSSIILPDLQRIKEFTYAVWNGGMNSHFTLIINGVKRGALVLYHHWWYLLPFAVAVVLIVMFTKETKQSKLKVKLVSGLILFILPLLPFLFLQQALSFRNFFPSLIGFGLIVDCAFSYLPFKRIATATIAIMFFLVSFSELTDYRSVSLADQAFVESIQEQAAKPSFTVKRQITLVPINVLYGQHITNVSESDWALTGCMRALTMNPRFPTIKVE